MNEQKSRYPSWWAYYYLVRNVYFLFGVPFLIFCAIAFTALSLDIYSTKYDYIYAYGSWTLLIIPSLWLYLKTRAKKKKILQVVKQIKESS
ncbi:ethanolamine utilization protein EutE, partial [Escherichia coli]